MCDATKQDILKMEPLKWLQSELKRHRFVVLLFYRGAWCCYCRSALAEANTILDQIRSMGGDLFAVCSQDKNETEKLRLQNELRYGIVSDAKAKLAKKYNINVTKKYSKLYEKIIKLAKSVNINTESLEADANYKYGMSQPGFVVVKNDGTVVYLWKGEPLERNKFGATDRVSAETIIDIVSFYFSCETQVNSIRSYLTRNISKVYSMVTQDPHFREKFLCHLDREYCADLLHFVESVDRIEALMKEHLNNPLKTFNYVTARNMLIDTYVTYLEPGSSHEICLPESILEQLDQYFIPCEDSYRGYRLKGSHQMPVLAPAYRHVKRVLREECLPRFAITNEFVNEGPVMIREICRKASTDFQLPKESCTVKLSVQ
jgi:peroxiredoxin